MKKYEEMTMEELWADFTAPVEEANIQTIDNIPQEKINFNNLFENQEPSVNQIQEQITQQQESPIELTNNQKVENFLSSTEEQFSYNPNAFNSSKIENSINQSVESLEQKSEVQSVNKPVFNKISALREKYNSPDKENTPTVNQEVSQDKVKPTIEERIESRRDFMTKTHEKQMQEALGSGDKDKIETLKLQHEYENAQFDVSSQRRLAKEKGDPSLAPTNEQLSKLNNAFSDLNDKNPDAQYTDYFSKKSFEVNNEQNNYEVSNKTQNNPAPTKKDISINDPSISFEQFKKEFTNSETQREFNQAHNYFDTFKEPESGKTIKDNMANAIEMNNVDKYEKGFYQAEKEMNRQHEIELNSATPKHAKINYERSSFELKRDMALHQKEAFAHGDRERDLYSHPAPTDEQLQGVFNDWREYKLEQKNLTSNNINYDREPTKLEVQNFEKEEFNSQNKNYKGSFEQYEDNIIKDQQKEFIDKGFSQDQVFNATQQAFNQNNNANISMASLNDKELQQVEQGQTPIGANQQLTQAMNNPMTKNQVQTKVFNEEFDRNFLAKEETLNPRKNKELEEQRLIEKVVKTSEGISKEFTQGSQQPNQQQVPQHTQNHNDDHIKKKKEFNMGFDR